MDSEHFIFNEIKSVDKEMYSVHVDGGFVRDVIFGGQEIIEDEIASKPNPYFIKTKRRPLEFEMVISPLDKLWTPEKRQEIAQWLIHDEYKSFQTCDDLGKIYYIICTNPWEVETNGLRQGYMRLQFRADAFHAWSPVYYQEFDLSNNTSTIITLENRSNVCNYYYPKLEILNLNSTQEIVLKNLNDNGREFKINNLHLNEIVGFDNEKKIIKSSLEESDNIFRLKDFNKHWLRLVYGKNQIQVTGKCILKVKSQFPIVR